MEIKQESNDAMYILGNLLGMLLHKRMAKLNVFVKMLQLCTSNLLPMRLFKIDLDRCKEHIS